ncbi:AbgT family transporter [Actinomadura sp. HBU206391]|uniref:AbgT family transporter n=1 Tax=Actinomadura sp. HBU206391 TaxID=2731692 RepID=UPI00165007D0|nr:AbgT family transporter [Actinomadura sp. HBU206391]MBC6460054.1 AbgT family transporter [Actinomadura sp. HBU206391]
MLKTEQRTILDRLLGGVERLGNRLPNPFVLFVGLFVLISVASAIAAALGATVQLPGADKVTPVKSVLSGEGIVHLLDSAVDNFVSFPALGPVLTVVLGVGVAQGTGALEAAVRLVFSRVHRSLVPYVVAFVACQGHVMSDASFLVIPPLAALVFRAVGRHPLAGLIGAYACTATGYGGGLLVGTLDASLAGITKSAAGLLPGVTGYDTNIAMNYYFGAAAGLILPIVGGLLISRVLEPRLPAWEPADGQDIVKVEVTARERRALLISGLVVTGFLALVLVGWLIQSSPLRGPGGSLIPSPLLDNLVPIIALVFFLFGYTYGRAVGLAKEDRSVYKLMTNAIKEMGGFITLIFIVAQTLSVLSWSGLATYLAVELASTAKAIGLVGFPALLFLVVLSTVLNLVITSGSGLWSLESTVMVPALMLLGLSPAVIQATHRIGDSITQAVSPMHIFLYFILAEAKKYEPDLKLGTLVSRLLPFVPAFGLVWTVILAIFYFAGLPVGPGASIHLP